MKRCRTCKKEKSLEEFGNKSETPDGKRYSCRECRKISCQVYKTTKRGKYSKQKENAKRRGVEWDMSFEEWDRLWGALYPLRGPQGLIMCRLNDEGPYHPDNVYLGTPQMNVEDTR